MNPGGSRPPLRPPPPRRMQGPARPVALRISVWRGAVYVSRSLVPLVDGGVGRWAMGVVACWTVGPALVVGPMRWSAVVRVFQNRKRPAPPTSTVPRPIP
ncbi:uncharacterized protein STAUR_8385 [Stigmatella aurantiaca DW4/3-1]|uniref:Uncharacterized protein n=1 Tax=Stigmatella aurantiaca (strain DW4/3-1) TaxID=378806 RepID=E3FZD8_STIAD|nr:uncharacterized protein STAUR_8385 [Stigmatella aurantiaca DW4/3-1]